MAVVLLVSGGVTLLVSGQKSYDDERYNLPIDGLLLTLLSGMLAGLKWTLSQVCFPVVVVIISTNEERRWRGSKGRFLRLA